MIIGTTYSHLHSTYLKLPQNSFEEILDLGLDTIRLGCYWNEIEKEKGVYDFTSIINLLDKSKKQKQSVIVTLGMKAPRWPEYYFPQWLPRTDPLGASLFALRFFKKALHALQPYTNITHWQIENEPLDPSGPDELCISRDILAKEIAMVREYDSRPVIINLWGNELKKRNYFPIAESLADVIGLDIYYKVPILGPFYIGPQESDTDFRDVITESSKPIFITELQAEPWERKSPYDSRSEPKSMNTKLLIENYKRANSMHPQAILFWGVEYWLWKRQQGDDSLWKTVQKIISDNR